MTIELEDIGQSKSTRSLLSSRREFSYDKLARMQEQLEECESAREFPDLTVFVAGSFGRLEGSAYSDIDLFFVSKRKVDDYSEINIPRIKFLSDVIRISDDLKFPKFSNDGEFLKFLFLDQMLGDLGSPRDDMSNHFTARMLMLLESKPVHGSAVFDEILDKLVNSYFRDYPHHPKDFRPTFLINDILRYWKTLCLNYEHKRNQLDDAKKAKQKAKNFKLKYSRLMTCFATVASICSIKEITPRDVLDICTMTPVERLVKVSIDHKQFRPAVSKLLDSYAWFLNQTGQTADVLENFFRNKENNEEAFAKADTFGRQFYELLREIDQINSMLRYLVI